VTIFDQFFSFKKKTREFVAECSLIFNFFKSQNGENSPQKKITTAAKVCSL
jgi:hypothetical protein